MESQEITPPRSRLFPKLGPTDAIKMHNYQVVLMGQLLSLAKVFTPHNSPGRPVLFNEMLLTPWPFDSMVAGGVGELLPHP